jgi:C-terminal processing protease CtpA/Prc
VALVENGPAAQAGLKVGDVIKRVNGNESPDAYGTALALVGTTEKVILGVQRGGESGGDLIELTITPTASLQTMPPTQSISGEIVPCPSLPRLRRLRAGRRHKKMIQATRLSWFYNQATRFKKFGSWARRRSPSGWTKGCLSSFKKAGSSILSRH